MPTYCKLKDGREMVVLSDNTDRETMHVFDVADLDRDIEAEWYDPIEVKYADILRTDPNRVVAYAVPRASRPS